MTEKIVGSKMPANNGYGQNGDCSASSSIGIAESSKLCGLDIGVPHEALDRLVGTGMPSDLAAFQGPTGQERPISDTPFPGTHGAVRQQDPQAVFGAVAKQLPEGDTYGDAQPVRKP